VKVLWREMSARGSWLWGEGRTAPVEEFLSDSVRDGDTDLFDVCGGILYAHFTDDLPTAVWSAFRVQFCVARVVQSAAAGGRIGWL
jgi:hypothetical protein